ncbi:MAG: hypothetical protein KDD45_17950 [Bdellovibrionales bacterium]|nr:hypothetical protein [Bdellovibrionales bacterium]
MNPQHRIFIGGFSQGAIAALHYALSTQKVPAGVISCSGYLLKHTKCLNMRRLPILLLQGKKDKIVSEAETKQTFLKLL